MATHINIGSSFDKFLLEESILEEATEVAIERIVDWLHADVMTHRKLHRLCG